MYKIFVLKIGFVLSKECKRIKTTQTRKSKNKNKITKKKSKRKKIR